MRGVHYVPEAASSLLSVGELEDRGARVVVDSLKKTVSIMRDQTEVLFGYRYRKVWRLSQIKDYRAHVAQEKMGSSGTALKSIPKISARLLYTRLGYPGKHIEGKLSGLMNDLGDHSFYSLFCLSYTEVKIMRKVSREPMSTVKEKLGKAHMDLWGPIEQSLQGMRYMLTITDQATRQV